MLRGSQNECKPSCHLNFGLIESQELVFLSFGAYTFSPFHCSDTMGSSHTLCASIDLKCFVTREVSKSMRSDLANVVAG